MSDERKSTLVSLMRPTKTDREALYDMARAFDSFRESQERHNGAVYAFLKAQGAEIQQVKNVVVETGRQMAELSGHVARADAQSRQASSHNLEQDEQIKELQTVWQKVGKAFLAIYENPRVRLLARVLIGAAAAYALAKGWIKELP